MRINSMTLKGFRTHTYTELDLAPSVNVVTGQNDVGKSNIIRAMEWVLYNTPATASVIQQGEPYAEVTLVLEDGAQVIRTRGKKDKQALNRYTLIEPNSEPMHFDAIGRDVPEAIRQKLGASYFVRPGETLPCGLNISRQQEQSFMLSESGGQRAAMLNVFTGAYHLDAGVKSLKADIRDTDKLLADRQHQYDAAAKELQRYNTLLSQVEPILNQANAVDQAIESGVAKSMYYADKLGSLSNLDIDLARIEAKLAEVSESPDPEQRIVEYESTYKTWVELGGYAERIKANESDSRIIREELRKLYEHAYNTDELIANITQLQLQHNMLVETCDRLTGLHKELDALTEDLQATVKEHAKYAAQYTDMLVKLDRCPMCNGVPDRDDIKDMLV